MSIFGTYYGSKKRKINKYPPPHPRIKRIVEPFCGGGAYMMKYPDYELIGIEKDKSVCDAYSILQSYSKDDISKIEFQQGDNISQHIHAPLLRQLARVPAGNKVSMFGFA